MNRTELGNLEQYLHKSLGSDIELIRVTEIGSLKDQGIKDFGYGKALEILYRQKGETKHAVLSIMRGDRYGHQFYWDRAAILMFEYEAGPKMHKHVKPLGLGYINLDGHLIPVKEPKEFFILNEKADGEPYFLDLERIKHGGLCPEDIKQAADFARWLASLHRTKLDAPDLYLRRIRELIGRSECIWGLVDSYPHPYQYYGPIHFQELEKKLIDWRWKLQQYTHRLSSIHGDFHPWNVLLYNGDFTVLDRSRGEWGEPADDIAAMSCNYILYGLYQNSSLSGDFERLYFEFWEKYLEQTKDYEILEVIAPFYAFRILVVVNPEWYPNHPPKVRKTLFRFLDNVISSDKYDYQNINMYFR